MPRNAQDFISFVASHFQPLEAMCRQRARFTSDDQLAAFLRPFDQDDKNLARLIGRMRDVGVLVELAGEWTIPPFLSEFLQKLSERHALASPRVIQSWVESLRSHVSELLAHLDAAAVDGGTVAREAVQFLLREIADVFQTIVRTVQDNCDRIASEIADYRKAEDAARLRSRLSRLIQLHDEYLEPVIRIIDINGDFYAVTEQISTCCARLTMTANIGLRGMSDDAKRLQWDVIWLRRVVIRRAEESRRELSPLCEAAARESKIAKGVNRALEAIRHEKWESLNLEEFVPVVDERDGTLFSDLAVGRYLRLAVESRNRPVPRVPATAPESLVIPISPEELIDKLDLVDSISDLLDWVLETCDDVSLDDAVCLFHAILERCSDSVRRNEIRSDYERREMIVNAARWSWKGKHDGDASRFPHDGRPAAKAGRGVPAP